MAIGWDLEWKSRLSEDQDSLQECPCHHGFCYDPSHSLSLSRNLGISHGPNHGSQGPRQSLIRSKLEF